MLKELTEADILKLEEKYGMVSTQGHVTGSPEYWKEIAETRIHTAEFREEYGDYLCEYSSRHRFFEEIRKLGPIVLKGDLIKKGRSE